jgi:plastocyanin
VRFRRGSLSAAVGVGISAAVLLGGCGTGSDLPSSSSASAGDSATAVAAGTVRVVMQSLSFAPNSVKGKVGQRVLWTNEDSSPHNVLYVSGPKFASSQVLNPGEKFSIRLTQSGTIHYYCSIHPWMKATVTVSG